MPVTDFNFAYLRRSFCFIGCLCCFHTVAATKTAAFPIEAQVFSAVSLSTKTNMDFGTHIVPDSGTTTSDAKQKAVLEATGNADAAVTGQFTNQSITLNCTTGLCTGDKVTVDSFKCTSGLNSSCSGNIGSDGKLSIELDATMHLTASDKEGDYEGQQTFELNYS